MRGGALLLVLVLLTLSGTVTVKPVAASGDFWTQKAPMHVARNGLGVAVVDGKIYAIGGSTESGSINIKGIVGANEEYDPTADSWVSKAPMPTPRRDFSIFAFQGKVYCVGGIVGYGSAYEGIATTANEVYDPITDTWQTRKPIPTPRISATTSVVGDKIYFIGGSINYTLNEVYDPATDSWTTKSPMPKGITCFSAVVGKRIFFVDAGEIYDTEKDSWSYCTPVPSDVYHGAATATTGAFAPIRIYFFGLNNWTSQGPMPNHIYNPKTDGWTLGTEVPTNREGFGIGVINDTLYVIGGRSHTFPLFPFYEMETVTQSTANEAYTPIGYGTPDPDYQPPTPSPSPSPTVSPSPSPSTSPTQSPENRLKPPNPELVYAPIAATFITIAAVAAVALKKRHNKNTNSINTSPYIAA